MTCIVYFCPYKVICLGYPYIIQRASVGFAHYIQLHLRFIGDPTVIKVQLDEPYFLIVVNALLNSWHLPLPPECPLSRHFISLHRSTWGPSVTFPGHVALDISILVTTHLIRTFPASSSLCLASAGSWMIVVCIPTNV